MAKKRKFEIGAVTVMVWVAIVMFSLSGATPVFAEESAPTGLDGTCTTCHEDLYLLHDTGNWFCLNESPMACVDCHGGNATSLDMDEAHTSRDPHPVLNDNVSKCQECHPDQCDERVLIFDETAGISHVLVAEPYQPVVAESDSLSVPVTGQVAASETLAFRVTVSLVAIAAVMLTLYVLFIRRQA